MKGNLLLLYICLESLRRSLACLAHVATRNPWHLGRYSMRILCTIWCMNRCRCRCCNCRGPRVWDPCPFGHSLGSRWGCFSWREWKRKQCRVSGCRWFWNALYKLTFLFTFRKQPHPILFGKPCCSFLFWKPPSCFLAGIHHVAFLVGKFSGCSP